MITILTPGEKFLPEYGYIIDCLFSRWLAADYRLTAGDEGKWILCQDQKILAFPNIFFPENFPEKYFEGNILHEKTQPHFIDSIDIPFPYALKGARDLSSVDIFGTIFFFLTCFEDTFFPRRTEFNGTISPSDTFLVQNSMHKRPVVDEILQTFQEFLTKNGFCVSSKKAEYSLQYSCDVDTPVLCYKKSFPIFSKHVLSSLVKHRSLTRFSSICKSKFNIDADPFYTFPWICKELAENSLTGCFNFKGGASSLKHDSPYSLTAEWVKELIVSLTRSGHEIGFHPSYRTPEDVSIFRRELANVQTASPIPVRGGRQHFLRFFGSATWKMWDDAGLEYDSTVGFNKVSGFRLGTAREFPVYDLQHRKALKLRERPLIAMDCTLLGYEGATPQEAFDRACGYAQQIRKYGGNMTLLWHNSYLETPEKRELFSQLLKYLA